jgi:hypothetical protein
VNLATDELAQTSRDAFAPDGAAADKVRATLVGLGLPIPIAVATVAEAVRDLRDGDDDGAVLTALAVWDDLMAGRSLVSELVALLDKHLSALRAAQAIAASSPVDLPEDLATQHAELHDLLEAGDLAGKLGRITTITSAISEHRANRLAELRAELRARVEAERADLLARYQGVDTDAITETLARLAQLVPDDTANVGPDVLEARLTAVQSTAADVAHALDVVAAGPRLATVQVSEIAPDLIRTPEELAVVVERLHRRVAELLGDRKEVRLK